MKPFGSSTTARTDFATATSARSLHWRWQLRDDRSRRRTVTSGRPSRSTVDAGGTEHVDPRAEANDAHPLALLDALAFIDCTVMNAARNEARRSGARECDAPPASRPTDVCSFSRLDSSAAALRKLAGLARERIARCPITGYRFTWTLKTFMKIDTPLRAAVHERRLVDLRDHDDLAVRRRDDQSLAALAGALGIAKEVRDPERDEREQRTPASQSGHERLVRAAAYPPTAIERGDER